MSTEPRCADCAAFLADDGASGLDRCPKHVACDTDCQALAEPHTPVELVAAVDHWQNHSYLAGCSHGN